MNHWVEVSVPAQFRLGVGGIADQCGWRVKMQGDRAFVCTEENYTKTKPKLFTSVRLVDAKNADDQRLYRRLDTWPSQDEIIPEEGMPDVVDDEIMRRVSAGRPEEWWAGLSLAFMSVPDAEVSRHVFDAYTTTIAPQMPESSLWLTEFKPELSWRLASIRALFGATEAPELLDREGEWLGFQAARGLMNSTMFGFGPFIDVALLVAAPWLVGISSARRGGMLTVMFGKPQSGRAEFVSNELLDQFKPTGVLSAATRHIRNAPTFTADDAERFLAWWVDRINALLDRKSTRLNS